MKEMVNSYNHANQYVKLKGRQIDVREEGVAKKFGLSHEGVVLIGRESYNPIVATYFTGDEHEHNIPCSGYLIAKADGK
jgi:phage gp37-like protein